MAVSELSSAFNQCYEKANNRPTGSVSGLFLQRILRVFAIVAAPLAAQADDSDPAATNDLLRNGQILSLTTVLDMIRPVTHGNVLEVEIDSPDHDLAYEIYYLDPDGSRHVIYVSARTGQVLPGKPCPVRP